MLGVEAWIKAENRHDIYILLFVFGLLGSPVNDRIIMHPKIVSQPQDYSMHLSLTKLVVQVNVKLAH